MPVRKSLPDRHVCKMSRYSRPTYNQNECIERKEENIISERILPTLHYRTISLINAASKSKVFRCRYPRLVLDEKEHYGKRRTLALLYPIEISMRVLKTASRGSSLNFKLKNTVGYRVIGKFPPRSEISLSLSLSLSLPSLPFPPLSLSFSLCWRGILCREGRFLNNPHPE